MAYCRRHDAMGRRGRPGDSRKGRLPRLLAAHRGGKVGGADPSLPRVRDGRAHESRVLPLPADAFRFRRKRAEPSDARELPPLYEVRGRPVSVAQDRTRGEERVRVPVGRSRGREGARTPREAPSVPRGGCVLRRRASALCGGGGSAGRVLGGKGRCRILCAAPGGDGGAGRSRGHAGGRHHRHGGDRMAVSPCRPAVAAARFQAAQHEGCAEVRSHARSVQGVGVGGAGGRPPGSARAEGRGRRGVRTVRRTWRQLHDIRGEGHCGGGGAHVAGQRIRDQGAVILASRQGEVAVARRDADSPSRARFLVLAGGSGEGGARIFGGGRKACPRGR